MRFDVNTSLGEIVDLPCFVQMEGQFISSATVNWLGDKRQLTLGQLQAQNPSWNYSDIIYGLDRLQEVAMGGERYVYPVGEGAHLIHLPAKSRRYETYAILNAGGAYGAVCTMVESLPVAAKLNELGMDCFCLNYSTANKASLLKGLMPAPLDDLSAAWNYIKEHETKFRVNAEKYIVGGFSAGGHLSAMWGTSHRGARSYGIVNPEALLLAYPLIGLENIGGSAAAILKTGMLGMGFRQKKASEYTASRHVDDEYPSVYLVQVVDDDTVPAQDAKDLEAALMAANIRHQMERVASGGHGFGLGSATPADGWVERAIAFWEGK